MLKRNTYVLIDPTNMAVRYVGSTFYSLKDRLAGHMNDAKNRPEGDKGKWIASLTASGLKPECVLVSEMDIEREVIIALSEEGADLLNKTLPANYNKPCLGKQRDWDDRLSKYSLAALVWEMRVRGWHFDGSSISPAKTWRTAIEDAIKRIKGGSDA